MLINIMALIKICLGGIMDVLEAIRSRRSIRRFKADAVPDDIVMKVLDATHWAPSARNQQPVSFIVIKDNNIRKQIANLAPWGSFIGDSPVAIAIVTDPSSKWHIVDGSLASQNLMLAAHSFGLGTCWVGGLEREDIKKLMGVPEHLHILTVMPLGYPDEKGSSQRKDLDDIVHREKW